MTWLLNELVVQGRAWIDAWGTWKRVAEAPPRSHPFLDTDGPLAAFRLATAKGSYFPSPIPQIHVIDAKERQTNLNSILWGRSAIGLVDRLAQLRRRALVFVCRGSTVP